MTPESAVEIIRHSLLTALWVAAPLLLIGFLAGIVISLCQIVTSIQDSAFNTIPRLLAFLAGLFVFMPWMLSKLTSYTLAILGNLGRYAR
jgi:flagellar biosynthesis protein FliQ